MDPSGRVDDNDGSRRVSGCGFTLAGWALGFAALVASLVSIHFA